MYYNTWSSRKRHVRHKARHIMIITTVLGVGPIGAQTHVCMCKCVTGLGIAGLLDALKSHVAFASICDDAASGKSGS